MLDRGGAHACYNNLKRAFFAQFWVFADKSDRCLSSGSLQNAPSAVSYLSFLSRFAAFQCVLCNSKMSLFPKQSFGFLIWCLLTLLGRHICQGARLMQGYFLHTNSMQKFVESYSNAAVYTVSGGSSYGRSGRPPHWPKFRAGVGARLSHGGKFSLKPLTFGHFFCVKLYSFRGASPPTPHQGLCPWTPLGAPPPDPRLGSRSARSPWSAPPPFGKSWIRHWKGKQNVRGLGSGTVGETKRGRKENVGRGKEEWRGESRSHGHFWKSAPMDPWNGVHT